MIKMKAKMRLAKRLCALALAMCLCLAVSVTALADNTLDTSAEAVENSDGSYDIDFSATINISSSVAGLIVATVLNNNIPLTITFTLTSDLIGQLGRNDISFDLSGSYGLDCDSSLSVSGSTATATFVLTSPFGELDDSNTADAQSLVSDVQAGKYSNTVTANASMTSEQFEAAGGSGTITYSAKAAISASSHSYSYSDSGTVNVTEYDSGEENNSSSGADSSGSGSSSGGTTTDNTTGSATDTATGTTTDTVTGTTTDTVTGTGSSGSSSSTSGTTTDTSTDDTALAFSDVSAEDYFYDAVYWAVEQGITNGTADNSFSPNSGCTRAQAVTFLWRAHGSPAPASSENPFTDISDDDYFCQAALWAYENGITTGATETTFDPDAACSRAQIATFLYRASGESAEAGSVFTDVSADDYYAAAVTWAAANGITTGATETTFAPDSPCTRAQIVTFLYRDMA